MASLAVPPPSPRHRASSTNMRPALTLGSLGVRTKACGGSEAEEPPYTPPVDVFSAGLKSSSPLPSGSRISALVEKCFDLIHPDNAPPLPPPSTVSSDDSNLPLSAVTTVVGDMFEEKQSAYFKTVNSRMRWQSMPSVHTPILFVLMLFPVSTAIVLFGFWSLPFSFSWPQNISDMAQLGRELHGYSQSSFSALAHVVGVISVATVWMHAWSVPGSVLWNVLAGALFSPLTATVLLAVLTTVGSIFATLLATPVAPFVTHFFPKPLAMARSVFDSDSDTSATKSPAWVRLTVLRLVGIVPWSGINVACGVMGIAMKDCVLGTFIGSIPWTAVTCQIGDILQTVASTPSPNPQTISSILTSPSLIMKLVFLSFLSLAPILGRDYLRAWISPTALPSASEDEDSVERASRWAWIKEWRSKVRIASRSRTRESSEVEIEDLVLEKQRDLS